MSDLFTLDYHDIVNDPDIDIVIELIGGTTVARDVVVSALEAGKNVVTANKALMATHGEEVMHLAEKMNREIAFEASVGGGIPIIDPLKHSLISNEITSVMGIVNGTTNYMLTRMVDDNLSYDQALKEAQERGFAEADPTADVDGFDALVDDYLNQPEPEVAPEPEDYTAPPLVPFCTVTAANNGSGRPGTVTVCTTLDPERGLLVTLEPAGIELDRWQLPNLVLALSAAATHVATLPDADVVARAHRAITGTVGEVDYE